MELNLVILLFVVLNHKNWNQQQSSELKHLSEHFTFLSKIFFYIIFLMLSQKYYPANLIVTQIQK